MFIAHTPQCTWNHFKALKIFIYTITFTHEHLHIHTYNTGNHICKEEKMYTHTYTHRYGCCIYYSCLFPEHVFPYLTDVADAHKHIDIQTRIPIAMDVFFFGFLLIVLKVGGREREKRLLEGGCWHSRTMHLRYVLQQTFWWIYVLLFCSNYSKNETEFYSCPIVGLQHEYNTQIYIYSDTNGNGCGNNWNTIQN